MRDPGLRSEHREELQVGILVLVGIAAVVAGVFWITGTEITREQIAVHVAAPEAAQVSEGSRVYLHGVDVGSVTGVELTRDGVVVDLRISSDVSLPTDSRALIKPSGFLGSQMVQLVPGGASETVAAGDTIGAGTAPSLQDMAAQLGGRAEQVLARTSRVLSDSTVRALQDGAGDLSGSLRELRTLVEEEQRTVARMLESLERTSAGLARATSGPELERTLTQLDSLSRRLNRTSEGLNESSRSLASILDKMDRGEGSLGKLVNDDRLYDQVAAAAENVQAASEEIALLTKDIRQRPDRYLGALRISVF